jgi:hypothetical protein
MADTSTPGTFIPHDTAITAAAPRARGGGLNDLFLLMGIVLLVASGALAVGVFLYAQFMQSQSTSKLEQLQRAEAAFQPSLIDQITRLDDRMHAASTVLGAHLAPTAFFQALDQATLQTISFSSLHLEATDQQHITLTMQGVAQSVNSIALQAELFSKNGVITDPIFSNIARQQDGVHFDFSAIINPTSLNYETVLNAASAPQQQTQNAPAPQSSAPASVTPFGSLPAQGTTAPAQ